MAKTTFPSDYVRFSYSTSETHIIGNVISNVISNVIGNIIGDTLSQIFYLVQCSISFAPNHTRLLRTCNFIARRDRSEADFETVRGANNFKRAFHAGQRLIAHGFTINFV